MQERFKKNILSKYIGEDGQKKISESKIALCGIGGIGTHVLANLLALGARKITIIEKDSVELSNLNRQIIYKTDDTGKQKAECAKKWALEFFPDCKIDSFNIHLTEENISSIDFQNHDLIIDCFDDIKSVALLHKIALETQKPLITGGVNDCSGFIMTVFPKKTDCLGCFDLLKEPKTKKELGVLAPTCALLASAYSFEFLKITLNIETPIVNGPVFFDGMRFKTLKPETFETDKTCPVCGRQMKTIKGLH